MSHLEQARAAQQRAPTLTRHGVFMSVFGLGVMLSGASGVGKSELALDLISRGHALVADDAVDFQLWAPGVLVGSAAPLLYGFMEARGLGILDIARCFGSQALCLRQRLDLVLQLDDVPPSSVHGEERLHGRRSSAKVLGVEVAQIELARGLGHYLAPLVETACRDHWLRLNGYAADAAFVARQLAAIGSPRT